MSESPTLLFLHGIGSGDRENGWKAPLTETLTGLGHPGLDGIPIIAPKYPHSLRGVDDDIPLPELTVQAPTGGAASRNRRAFERREAALEAVLGRTDRGKSRFSGDAVVDGALNLPQFIQATNYLREPRIRAHVLTRILEVVPTSGKLVLVGHSLGSVIAADLVRRLPARLDVVGMVTIGSPLGNEEFQVDGLGGVLKSPPTNLGWWVNFWNPADPVAAGRGISSVFPWMIDVRVDSRVDVHVHDATRYLSSEAVARAIGYGLHGSLGRDLARIDKGVDIPLNSLENWVLMALRYGHLIAAKLEGDMQDRFSGALRHVQAETFSRVSERSHQEGRPLPAAIADLAVDLSDPDSVAAEPERLATISHEDAVVVLVSLATTNTIRPFEISVSPDTLQEALEDLSIELGLGRQFGRDVIAAVDSARKELLGSRANWIKWAALGVGAAALVAATGGLALAAAPGVAGAAVLTSALATFGPGGMVGGLLTAGALVSAGGGGVAIGLTSPATAAETVEAVVSSQLAAALLRRLQGLEQDPSTWSSFTETRIELQREHTRLSVFSDDSAPGLKELERKLDTVDRALTHLEKEGLAPAPLPESGKKPATPLFDAFRSVDIDGDGIPDRPRARVRAEEAGSAIKGAFGSLVRREQEVTPEDGDGHTPVE
ncbi:hypothetical protein [Acidipropionibacterium virtanenii]|uniref:Uncharacterized protein n=1 Tax=Acidipropionibacterium virtanenii TaxID=2057246 RepID=A0A344UR66_9ACTN|nr:hypothetical protein [Acidipropionibacterium virtanenii]AXE37764.1 hypothetical protein JS278_00571 [Acidipropionibacterium virtanenii]